MARHDADRVQDVVADWLAAHDRGEAVDIEEILRRHPDIADELRAQFEAHAILGLAFAESEAGDDRGTPSMPREIGDYRILGEIGRGGMGVVYEAEQISMRRKVALKVLSLGLTAGSQAVKRFEREARAAGKLHHTHIVPVHAMGQHSGYWYYAMELVEGRPLSDVIRELRDAPDRSEKRLASAARSATADTPARLTGTDARSWFMRVAEMFAGVADALDLAHREGVVHRDIKPSNLLLDADGTLKIVDFGLAQLDEGIPSMTLTGDLLGTPAYMSPEQAMARRMAIDHRTDVYSLGATFYELLTCKQPFSGTTIQEICSQIMTKDPVLPRRIDAKVPRDLETIVLKAMEKDRDKRYQTAGEFAQDLRRFTDGGSIKARRIGPAGRAWRLAKRHKVRTALGVSVVVLALAGAWLADRTRRTAEEARHSEYERLYMRGLALLPGSVADEVIVREWGVGLVSDDHDEAREYFSRAAALMPERFEAFLWRAFCVGPAPERLADVERARKRGLPASTYHLLRAHFLLMDADRIGSDAAFERGSALASDSPLDAYLLARRAQNDDDVEEAMRRLSMIIESHDTPSALRYLARRARAACFEAVGETSAALEDWLALRGAGDFGIEAALRVIAAWTALGREDEARRALEAAVIRAERDLFSLRCFLLRAQTLESFWSAPTVRACLERAARDYPDDLTVQQFAAIQAAKRNGDGEAELRALRQLLESRGENHGILHNVIGVLLRLERYDEAEELAERCASTYKCVSADYERCRALVGLGRCEDALTLFHAASERATTDSTIPAQYLVLGAAFLEKGSFDGAVAVYQEAIRRRPGFVGAHNNLGNALTRKGDLDGALAAYREAVRLDPEFAGAHHNLGNALSAKRDFDGALGAYREAIRLKPGSAKSHKNMGRGMLEKGDIDGALASVREAIRLNPDDAEAHYILGNALIGKSDFDGAVAAFREATRLKPDFAKAHYNLGNVLLGEGDIDGALASIRAAIRIKPDLVGAHGLLGNALIGKGDLDGALAAYREAVRLEPDSAEAHYGLGNALIGKGDLDGALAAFLEATRLKPELAEAHYGLGNAIFRKGDLDGALAAYREAIRLKPDFALAHCGVGSALMGKGDGDGALAAFREAIRLKPDSALAHYGVGSVLMGKGDLDGALAAYRLAIRLKPDVAEFHCNLGLTLLRKGRPRDALESLRRGHELGSRRPDWRNPSKQWVEMAERSVAVLVDLEARLPGILAGKDEPKSANDCVALAQVCLWGKRFADAVFLYDKAFGMGVTAPLHRYNAACAGVMANTPKWRGRALAWLRGEVERLTKDSSAADATFQHWQRDPDLAPVRDRIETLPEAERAAWQKLWADVDARLNHAVEK